MPYSICPFCSKRSYSAADLKRWICPYCGKEVIEGETDKKEDEKDVKEEQG